MKVILLVVKLETGEANSDVTSLSILKMERNLVD
jgi:hypothetical protein